MKHAKISLTAVLLLAATTTWAGAQESKHNRDKEHAQERASGIHDQIDITSGPNFQQTGPHSGRLTWTTNKEAATKVDYGTNRGEPHQHAGSSGGARQHSVELKDLRPGSTYYYEIETRTGKDRFKGQFQTAGSPGDRDRDHDRDDRGGHTTAQERASGIHDSVDITGGPNFQQTGRDSGMLTWTTNHTAATKVDYGTNRNEPRQHAFKSGGATNHSVELRNLKPHTTYYYEIETRYGKDRYKGQFQTR